MKIRLYFSLVIAAIFFFSSCTKDTSVYLSQVKKDVPVDDYNTDGTSPGGTEGELKPGINLVKLMVTYNGVETERRFKYVMPVSIDRSKPISLVFNFHGSYGTLEDPMQSVSLTHPLSQLAIKQNFIVVFPAGEDTGAAVNWQNSEYHLPFVDAMVDYFKNHSPMVDPNRIYTCGHSSGAIFSFVLAYERSDVFAAAVPVAGQMKISGTNYPSRAVPIRAFNGTTDATVSHAAAMDNIKAWANLVAGYFSSDAVLSDTLKIDNYKSYLKTTWNGGKTDIELFSIIDEGHSINWSAIMPLMWEFMQSHPKNVGSSGLYLSSDMKRFDAIEGQSFTSEIRYTAGATLTIESAPSDWQVSLAGGKLTVKAPVDFFAATTINRKGEIKLKAVFNGTSAVLTLPFSLAAPKTYYEVGDLVYDSQLKPTGIVFWVNPSNIKEAKMIALEHVTRQFGAVGTSFFTPSMTDGYQNTLALVEQNKTLTTKLTSATSAFLYAYEYKSESGKTNGWYLPAVDELKLLDANLTTVNAALKQHGVALELTSSSSSYYMSSTMVNIGTEVAPKKQFYTFDYNTNPNWHGYYTLSANTADNSSYVSTRPVKKITKQ